MVVARWESSGGKHWAELHDNGDGSFSYRGNGCGGFMGAMSQALAIAELERKVGDGYFLPDVAKTPMKRVK
jgi:hypothetical protein